VLAPDEFSASQKINRPDCLQQSIRHDAISLPRRETQDAKSTRDSGTGVRVRHNRLNGSSKIKECR